MDEQPDDGYGLEFLQEFRRLGGLTSTWTYAVVTAIEVADRNAVVALLRKRDTPYRILQIATTESPQDLARAVLAEMSERNAGAAGVASWCVF